MKKKPKIGIALGCGGARGLAHVGVLKVLLENGIDIDMVIGVSMGAIVGAYFALGFDMDSLEEEAISFNKRKALLKLVDVDPFGKSLIKGKKIKKYISDLFDDSKFSDMKIPFYALATDLANGEEVILKKGNLVDSVMASISMPGIFSPVKMGDKYLVDGGIANPTPVDLVEEMGADIVIGVDLVMKQDIELHNPGMMSTIMQSYEIIRTQGVKYNLNKCSEAVIIKPKFSGVTDVFKFHEIEKFILSGEEAAMAALPEIKRKITKFNKSNKANIR